MLKEILSVEEMRDSRPSDREKRGLELFSNVGILGLARCQGKA